MNKIEEHLVEVLAQVPLKLEQIRTELQAGLADSHNAGRLTGARSVPAGRPLVWGGPGRLVGWSLRAVGGAVSVTLVDSRDTSGEIIAVVELADATAQTITLPTSGVSFVEGLRSNVTGPGSLQGAFWLGAVD